MQEFVTDYYMFHSLFLCSDLHLGFQSNSIRKSIDPRIECSTTYAALDPALCAHGDTTYLDDVTYFDHCVYFAVHAVGYHECSSGCTKYASGRTGCRGAYPQPIRDERTGPIQLVATYADEDGLLTAKRKAEIDQKPRNDDPKRQSILDRITKNDATDKRILLWELTRPCGKNSQADYIRSNPLRSAFISEMQSEISDVNIVDEAWMWQHKHRYEHGTFRQPNAYIREMHWWFTKEQLDSKEYASTTEQSDRVLWYDQHHMADLHGCEVIPSLLFYFFCSFLSHHR